MVAVLVCLLGVVGVDSAVVMLKAFRAVLASVQHCLCSNQPAWQGPEGAATLLYVLLQVLMWLARL